MFAGGQFAVGISTNGGQTWTEQQPQGTSAQAVYYVVSGPRLANGSRHVFAAGSRIWHSADGGQTWSADPKVLSAGSPADGPGYSARCLCVDPTNPLRIYFARDGGELWRGVLPASGTGAMSWTQLPSPPKDYDGTTASGADFILVHRDPNGERQLIYSDRRTVHASSGEPSDSSDWTRIDGTPVHVDPHGAAVTPTFNWAGAGRASGRIALVNDGGVVFGTDGAETWSFGAGLSTLGLVNTAVLPRRGEDPTIVVQSGDNNGFVSSDGGRTWETQDYRGGDNGPSFADPRQPDRLYVVAGRSGTGAVFLYTADAGDVPDASWGTDDRVVVPSPAPPAGESRGRWNVWARNFQLGYRPLVLTHRTATHRFPTVTSAR